MKVIANENVAEMKKSVATKIGVIKFDRKTEENVKVVNESYGMSHGSHRSHSSS